MTKIFGFLGGAFLYAYAIFVFLLIAIALGV